jgi:sulfur carrier protein
MQVTVNGANHALPPAAQLQQLIDTLQLTHQRIAVEVNGDIVPRSRHAQYPLHEGDTVLIVQAIGGG